MAEQVYAGLPPSERQVARDLLLRLVDVRDGEEVPRGHPPPPRSRGLTTVTTGAAGHADGTVQLAALPPSSMITATATPLATDGTPTSTSEFSECMAIRG